MEKTYYIFRHGETFATLGKRWYWNKIYSAPILEEGKPSIIRLAEYLKKIPSDYNVSSPYLRCRQTTEMITGITKKKFVLDVRIREYAFELPWLFKKRILRFINDMENSNHEVIMICTHAIVIESLIQYLLNGHISMRERLIAPLPGVLTVIKDNKISEINFNIKT